MLICNVFDIGGSVAFDGYMCDPRVVVRQIHIAVVPPKGVSLISSHLITILSFPSLRPGNSNYNYFKLSNEDR